MLNYRRFRVDLAETGVPLLTVEVAFGDQPFELRKSDSDILVRLRGRDVLWQKERILNIGVKRLPPDCDKVAWIDADVLFQNPRWAVETSRLLEEYVVVQPYSHCVRLRRDELSCDAPSLPWGNREAQIFYSMAYGLFSKGRTSLRSFFEHGQCGLAWACRRSVIERHGLYDANLLGTGDTDISYAMYGHWDYWMLKRFGPAVQEHLKRWAERFYVDVQGSVVFVEGLVLHLWHGDMEHRLYGEPLEVLHDFDPDRDVEIDPSTSLYRWSEEASPTLKAWCQHYFAARREE